jgi:hypothetical protein
VAENQIGLFVLGNWMGGSLDLVPIFINFGADFRRYPTISGQALTLFSLYIYEISFY